MTLDTSKIAASVGQIKRAFDMDFLKAVVIAVLIHIVAPLAVRFIEANFTTYCVYETRGVREDNCRSRC